MRQETQERYVAPVVNIIDKTDTVLVEAELPGVPKDGAEIEIKDGELKIIGHRKFASSSGQLRINERPRADYLRAFTLSNAIDPNNIQAEMKDGILTVKLHKVEAMKPRRITVQ